MLFKPRMSWACALFLLRLEADSQNFIFNNFPDTMTVRCYKEQIARTKEVTEVDLIYYGIVCFGDWDKV